MIIFSSSQIADLLNYLFIKPNAPHKRKFAISPVVITAMRKKEQRNIIQNWCERQLREAGYFGEIKKKAGRPIGKSFMPAIVVRMATIIPYPVRVQL